MMQFPTAILEGKRLPRIILSIRPLASSEHQQVTPFLKKLYEMGAWCFDLPTAAHLEAFKDLKTLTEDEALMGLPHLRAEEGASFLGNPLHRHESKVISTIRKNLFPSEMIRNLKGMGVWNSKLFFSATSSSEVFTQKELDRITFDPTRFDKALSTFHPKTYPFLLFGEKYGDWLIALGKIDLLQKMVSRIREKGFIPIFSGRWATFLLPKAKALNAAAYAIPINRKWGLFDLPQACNLIKKFDKPVLSLNPLANGELLGESEEAFSFLFNELKIYSAIVEVASGEEAEKILEAMGKFPSLTPHRRA